MKEEMGGRGKSPARGHGVDYRLQPAGRKKLLKQ
jgi:hypothetical protein